MSPPAAGDFTYVPPRPLAVWAFARYFRGLFRRHFTSTRWASLSDHARWDAQVPTLVVANHTNWWDGFYAFLLTQELGLRFHILMQADQLERYAAFRRIGVLPMRRGSLKGAWTDLRHAARHLRPGNALWIFPQGQRRPALEAPDRLERGAGQLLAGHEGPLRLVPVAFRYPFLSEQLPEGFALVGEPELLPAGGRGADRAAATARIAERLRGTVALLDERLAAERVEAFRVLVPGKLSVNKRMDRVRHALGLMRGPFEARNG